MKRKEFLTKLAVAGLGMSLFQKAAFAEAISGTKNFNSALLPYTGATGRVIVVGGGMAGTTAAKFLRLWGGAGVQVTLIEPNATYYSNIFSNMVLTGERTLSQLAFNYTNLRVKYGVTVVNSSVTSINPAGKTVQLSNGSRLAYDRLIVAPGIDFEPLPISGTSANIASVVHAWKAGTQTESLRSQIAAMTRLDTFILAIPPKPYRCPPGPYERACVVADYLKRVKGGGKVVILDANPAIQAEINNFTRAFSTTHRTVITYVPNAIISSIDANTRTVRTGAGNFSGKVLNIIPTHKAGNLVTNSNIGLANNAGKWAGVNVLTYESTAVPFIHVIGDSSATTQPKAGHIANAEAKVCADAIIQLLQGLQVNQSPVTNSSCFTPITSKTASWLSVVFKYDPATRTMIATGNGVTESNGYNSDNYEDMLKWFQNLMADTFS